MEGLKLNKEEYDMMKNMVLLKAIYDLTDRLVGDEILTSVDISHLQKVLNNRIARYHKFYGL